MRTVKRAWSRRLLAAVPASRCRVPGATAQSPEEFYRGKTVEIVIGSSVGGGYDIYAR